MKQILRTEHTCPICGRVFLDIACHKRTYCSRKCLGQAAHQMAHRIQVACEWCATPFVTKEVPAPSDKPQRFCSHSCSAQAMAASRGLRTHQHISHICLSCGKEFTPRRHLERPHLFCSRKCWKAHYRGPNHRFWKGGYERYFGPNWDEQRDLALDRDGHRCRECDASTQLAVHHIVSRRAFGKDWVAMNALSNLITLCHPCHSRLHISRTDRAAGSGRLR